MKKINNFKIKPVVHNIVTNEDWPGKDVFPKRKYFNLALLSHTGAGKTTVIFNLVKKFRDKYTVFLIFSSTYQLDPTYREIIKWIEKKGNGLLVEDHFLENNQNHLEAFMEEYRGMLNEEEKKEPAVKQQTNIYGVHPSILALFGKGKAKEKSDAEIRAEKRAKEKLNFIIVLDDLSKDLRKGDTIETLLKKSRHYHTRVFISSQTLSDIAPSSHSQLYALCLFSGIGEKDIDYIYSRYAMPVKKEVFLEMYREAMKTKYAFLTILPAERQIRLNLDTELVG